MSSVVVRPPTILVVGLRAATAAECALAAHPMRVIKAPGWFEACEQIARSRPLVVIMATTLPPSHVDAIRITAARAKSAIVEFEERGDTVDARELEVVLEITVASALRWRAAATKSASHTG
jgi:AmiR/NasT family two-component response regulator